MSKTGRLILAIGLVVVLCLTLAGCGTLRYSMTVQTGGARLVEWTVDMTGESDQAFNKALVYATAIADQRKQQGRPTELTTDGKIIRITEQYASADEYYIAAGYTGWEPNEPDDREDKGFWSVYRSTSPIVSHGVVVSYALGYLACADLTAYNAFRLYWQNKALTLSSPDREVALAVVSNEDMSTTLAVYLDGEDEQAERLYTYTLQGFHAVGYDLDQMLVKYDYEHTYKSVYGLDATEIPSSSGTVYEWETDLASLADLNITICQKAPLVWAWELVAIAAGVFVTGVVAVIVIIKRRKQNATREEV